MVFVSPHSPPVPAPAADAPTLYCHLDIVERHPDAAALARILGWVAPAPGCEIIRLGLRVSPREILECNFPFFRGDQRETIAIAGRAALTGFNTLLPARLAFTASRLEFVALIASGDSPPRPYTFAIAAGERETRRFRLGPESLLAAAPEFTRLADDEAGELIEARLFDRVAARRHVWLRLDLINRCNLRCVMCHYSNADFRQRPVQRIEPGEFFAFFDPIAPIVREVVLSCGDEPLMSPHFESIVREIAARDPEIGIRFCTNGMLLTEKIADTLVAANVHQVTFSFDAVTSGTLHRIRVGSDYRRIVKNIVQLGRRRAARGGNRPVIMFNFVMLESNVHEAPLFVEVARRLGASSVDFRHVVPFEFYDIEHEMLEYHQPKYNFYRARIAAAAQACGMKVFLPPPFSTEGMHDPSADPAVTLAEFHDVLRSLGEPLESAGSPPTEAEAETPEWAHYFCDRPFTEIMIRDRDVYPCPWHREALGRLDGAHTLEDIFFGGKFRRLRRAMLDPHGAPGCAQCPIKADYLPVQAAPARGGEAAVVSGMFSPAT